MVTAHAGATEGLTTIYAKWVNPANNQTFTSPTITTETLDFDCSLTQETPVSYSPLSPACALTYSITGSTSWASGFIQSGLTSWQSTGRVGFVVNNNNPRIYFLTDETTTQPIGRVVRITGSNEIDVYVNRVYLDGDPTREIPSDWPPLANNHVKTAVVAHEVGHVLGFVHNDVDAASLMTANGIAMVFTCGTEAPTNDELYPLAVQYPSLCP